MLAFVFVHSLSCSPVSAAAAATADFPCFQSSEIPWDSCYCSLHNATMHIIQKSKWNGQILFFNSNTNISLCYRFVDIYESYMICIALDNATIEQKLFVFGIGSFGRENYAQMLPWYSTKFTQENASAKSFITNVFLFCCFIVLLIAFGFSHHFHTEFLHLECIHVETFKFHLFEFGVAYELWELFTANQNILIKNQIVGELMDV